jgi:aspartate racemase
MRALAAGLIAEGAEAVVAGCTEVPLVLGQSDIAAPLIDSVDALARAVIAAARPAP